jgi:2-keto-4-pentenoate hydratase/2-oxohepta-3-ene-1,7-dioic acid hydratase in catechol pathway
MKIARFTHAGRTRLGVVEGDEIADIGSARSELPADLGALLAGGGLDAAREAVAGAPRLALADVALQAPIARPPEFLAIGLNYGLHIEESGRERPKVPVVFNKQATCVNGPFDPIHIPAPAPDHVDYEGELGIVIGRAAKRVPAERAADVIAGYVVVNDVSVRDWQRASATMTMGKSWDTHGPIGPWMVTGDELGDPQAQTIRTWVSGDLRQDGKTADMIFGCYELIEHLSTAFTLLPGTIIATGTPDGVGMAMKPPGLLSPGDTVRIEISGIGVIENPVIAEPAGG